MKHYSSVYIPNSYGAVTGANQGIGLGVAECCLANRAEIVYSLDVGHITNDFQALRTKYPNLKYIQTDVTQNDSVENAIRLIYDEE